MFDNNVQYEITLTNNSGVDYREWQTGSSVAIGQTLVFTITGENLANTIMSNVAQHNALRGRTEIVANAVALGGSSGGGVALGETSSTAYRGDNGKIAYDHSLSQGNPHNTTTSDINEGTNLFFTEDRVNQTVLTGLDTSTATPALATDQLLAAIGKLQSQINSMSPTWVDVTTLNGFSGHANIDWTQSLVEVANIDGLLWIRGFLRQTAIFSGSQVFTHTDSNYVGNINYPAIDAFDSVNLTDVKGRGVSLGNVSFTTVVNRVNPLVPIFQFTLVGILNQTYIMLEPTALSRA